jgi:hypothetical protein
LLFADIFAVSIDRDSVGRYRHTISRADPDAVRPVNDGENPMRKLFPVVISAALIASVAPGEASAKGCIRGMIAGGVAGHYAGHHAVAGAMAGCAAGHYYYKHKAAKAAAAAPAKPAGAH